MTLTLSRQKTMKPDSIPSILQGSKVHLSKLGQNQEILFKLDPSIPWVKTLFEELCNSIDESEKSHINSENTGHLVIELSLQKKLDRDLNENLLIQGNIDSVYHTNCVRCLDPMEQVLSINLQACFVPNILMEEPEYQDQDTVYAFNKEFDLYFYQRKEVNLEEFLKEYIYLNVETIPIHSESCKGLCQTCGVNLNHQVCEHREL